MAPRALHWVFKVPQRSSTIKFYTEVLGMQILRHEEFQEGCAAACNGPYDGKWSKTMVGYGSEDDHFVVELTYNYTIKDYNLGNDFNCITIHSTEAYAAALAQSEFPVTQTSEDKLRIKVTGGYDFQIVNALAEGDPVQSVALNITNIEQSVAYWQGILGMEIVARSDTQVRLRYTANQLVLNKIPGDVPLSHGTAYGRIAFSCPADNLAIIESRVKAADHKVLTPLVSLDTPGKATVQVVILADPDGYEICFVGDEAFRELSQACNT
ncbi:uncharacterized protein MONBRDRAFT_14416 [Monosiga brevicollis MX1]|uniref:VOC domain-containing protein n=1 Tax=Monosiga brevicollis TaxID=81824 RepID=A9USA3_MONBE|nr:uncharacterized protein MONBRDRAFT_14416 [Monosiga brevicollis MX1]EDQ92065.1 predicted protein [Monosiga brevicollis MX1]|eukprot:XP_001743351.1 hypothetical protein [Monosiga brevicollis MX1]